MAATIEQIVHELERNCDPNDTVDMSARVVQYLYAVKTDNGEYYFNDAFRVEKWHVLCLTHGISTVSEMVTLLKQYLPEHKDKHISLYNNVTRAHCMASNKLTMTKVFKFDFNKKIEDIPAIKHEASSKLWVQFGLEIKKFSERMTDYHKKHGMQSENSLVPFAQYFFVQHPEIEGIYCVSNTFYHRYEDIQKDYPELTDDDVDINLFEDLCGVIVCQKTAKELKSLCESRKTPKYVTLEGEFGLEELLEKYTITVEQVGILFELGSDGKFVCKLPNFMSAVVK